MTQEEMQLCDLTLEDVAKLVKRNIQIVQIGFGITLGRMRSRRFYEHRFQKLIHLHLLTKLLL